MDKKRKTKKKLKLSTPKKKSCPSNPHLICNKEVVIQLERLSDSVIAEMTAGGSALPPEQIMASNDAALNINSLPEEMLTNIFSHLSQNELGRIARVCRRWNVLTKRPALWKEVNVKFHKSHESQNTVTRCFVKMLPPCVACIRLDFKHFGLWVEQLNCEEFCARLQKICPHLERLIFEGAVLSCSIQSVINLCTLFLPDVKILVFNYSYFNDYSVGGELDGYSKIQVLDLSRSWLGFLSKPPFSRMSHLKQLRLSNTNVSCNWFEEDISFLNQLHVLDVGYTYIPFSTFSVIRDNGLNLKELFLCNVPVFGGNLSLNMSVFPHLKTICLRSSHPVTCEGVVSLIQSCHSLQNIYVKQKRAAFFTAHPYFVANKCQLEIVKFISNCDEHRTDAY